MTNWLGWTTADLEAYQQRVGKDKGRIVRQLDREPAKAVAKVLKEPTEHESQKAVVEAWAFMCTSYGLPEFALYAVPNGGKRHIKTASNLKAEGVRAGIPDLFLAAKSPRDTEARGLYLEMKRKPNSPSREQALVIEYLRRAGYHCVIAWSAAEAITAIQAYLKGAP